MTTPGTDTWRRTALLAFAALLLAASGMAHAATCGDGVHEPPEQCDDGDLDSGDGCSSGCLEECPSLDGTWLAQNTAPGSVDQTWEIDEDGDDVTASVNGGADTLTGTRAHTGLPSAIALASASEPITFSGEIFSCDVVHLDIDQLPFAITLTRQSVPPTCDDALPLSSTKVTISGLTGDSGNETLVATGRIVPPPGFVFDPEQQGVQVLLEDLGAGDARLFDVTHATRAIPPAPGETCPARGEGWRRNTYRSVMKPGDAASCRLGNADVLTLRLADLRPRRNELSFALRVRKATIAAPVGPVRLTIAFGTTADDLAAAQCGDPQPSLACTASANGKNVRCR